MNNTIIVPKQQKDNSEQNKRAFNIRGFGKDFFNAQAHPQRAAFRDITLLFLVSRLLFLLATYISIPLFPIPPKDHPSYSVPFQKLLEAWNQWDAANYVKIAQFGYQIGHDPHQKYNLFAFFPLYPYTTHLLGYVLDNYMLAGIILSNLAFYGATLVIYALAMDASQDAQVARRTILYLTFFPTAFFLFAAYNEAFFLFFCASALLAMRRRLWLVAALIGCLAALTRSAGVLLAIPYLWEWWCSRDKNKPFFSLKWMVNLAPILLIPVGIILYMLYCNSLTHDPLVFMNVQGNWGRHTVLPWIGIWNTLQALFTGYVPNYLNPSDFAYAPFASFFQIHMLIDLTATLSFMVLTILGWRILPKTYTLLVALLLLLTLTSPSLGGDPLTSNMRFVLELTPAFITLAILGKKHPRLHQGLIVAFPMLLAVFTLLFLEGKWMV
jgi:hypothetical protein